MRGKVILIAGAALLLILPLVMSAPGQAAPGSRMPYLLMADVTRADGMQANVFKPGDEVIFRARVLDFATGQDPGRAGAALAAIKDLGLKVTAFLEDGQSFPMTYGRHAGQGARATVSWYWTASWKIPTTYNAPNDAAKLRVPVAGGRYVKWWVVATDKAGASVRFDPVGVGTTLPPIGLIIK